MNRKEMNDHYKEIAEDNPFPFIGTNRIIILKKGLYSKKTANYRGISYIKDPDTGKYKAVLLGYYDVPGNYIIVPPQLEINNSKQNLIDRHLLKGYEFVLKCPSLKPIEFAKGTEQYEIAVSSHQEYKAQL